MAAIKLREGVLERIQRLAGLATDDAMAGAIGVSVETYRRVKSGKQEPSLRFLAGLAGNFGYQLGEVAQVVSESDTRVKTLAA